MATITSTTIVTKVSLLLQDATNIRWPTSELLDWLNDGQREIVMYKPNACIKNIDVALIAGTKQSLPADGVSLIDISRNTGGNAVRATNRQVLDAQIPDWHASAKANAKVVHYCYSPTDPRTFYVYPPSPGANSVEVIYCASPANATLGGVISIDDIYATPLINYIAYRAYSKDAEYAENATFAQGYYQAFMAQITGKRNAEVTTDPNVNIIGDPNLPKRG
jgi:hypothetical protein